jgi:hypothetical protein
MIGWIEKHRTTTGWTPIHSKSGVHHRLYRNALDTGCEFCFQFQLREIGATGVVEKEDDQNRQQHRNGGPTDGRGHRGWGVSRVVVGRS